MANLTPTYFLIKPIQVSAEIGSDAQGIKKRFDLLNKMVVF